MPGAVVRKHVDQHKVGNRGRCVLTHLADACRALHRASGALGRAPELAAEDLRQAGLALGRIAGRIDPEQVLDEVFASFCIGK